MGNMYRDYTAAIDTTIDTSAIDTTTIDSTGTDGNSHSNTITPLKTTQVFSPSTRTDHLFLIMDQDADGRADFADFKRTVLADPEIIQGFLVYDGVV